MVIKYNTKLPKSRFIACSGGIDSVCIAHFLSKNKEKPILLHYNHKLLSEDDSFVYKVEKLANDLNLQLVVGENTEKYISGSVEEYCRLKRYEWLNKFDGYVATAHHLDDVVENYLFNCIRGKQEYLPIPLNTNNIVRPFLMTTKKNFIDYATKHDLLKYEAVDPLNDDVSKTRNWIRKVLTPEIQSRYNLYKVVRKIYLNREKESKIYGY